MNQTCKHNQIKTKCNKCFEEKFGKVCKNPDCKKRKEVFSTSNGAEGGRDSICKCNENK